MTNPAFNSEDPRLTAFVLDEIDDSDRAEIEQLLETSTEARAAVKEIEETIGVLKEGLAGEPTPELTTEQRAVVVVADAHLERRGEQLVGEQEAELDASELALFNWLHRLHYSCTS